MTGPQTVTLTAPSGWEIFYTLNGSYPSLFSTLYTGPLTLTGSGELFALAYNPSTGQWSSDLVDIHYRDYGFKAGDQWYASNDFGNPVSAMSGNVTFTAGRYYMVGQYFAGGVNSNIPQPTDIGGVRLYSSPDLLNWTFENTILNPALTIDTRPHLLFNASTSQWVLWEMCSNSLDADSTDYACIATAPSITGPWSWLTKSLNPDGQGFKDNSLFQDDDGSAYVVYQNAGQSALIVSKLSADYLSTSGTWAVACNCSAQESPVLFKRQGVYFLIHGSSNLTSYLQDIQPLYQTAAAPLGSWSGVSPLFASDPVGTVFNGQPSAVFQAQGTTDGWVYLADLWRSPITTSTHILLPLTFADSTHVQAATPTVWDLGSLH